MFWEMLFLLLPVAAVTGWFLGWRSARRADGDAPSVSPEYYKGLNFLLNEQPDQAAEVFLRVLNVDSESVEVHHALASLFLKRGEFDRAIRIHQNLIARPSLSREQRHETLFLLANDYFRAGVLDRAEGLLVELQNGTSYSQQSLILLLSIYQQQRDWDKAIAVAARLQKTDKARYQMSIANYYCEIAETLPQQSAAQLKAIKKALSSEKSCARANILNAKGLMALGQYSRAIKIFARIESQDSTLLPDVLLLMVQCWEASNRIDDAFDYLDSLLLRYSDPAIFYCYAELVRKYRLDESFRERLATYLKDNPSLIGVVELLRIDCDLAVDDYRKDLLTLVEPMADNSTHYCCSQCGFKGHMLHWQCPSCQNWNSVRRVSAVH